MTQTQWIKPPEGHVWKVGQRIKLAGLEGRVTCISGRPLPHAVCFNGTNGYENSLDLSLFPDILVEEVRPRISVESKEWILDQFKHRYDPSSSLSWSVLYEILDEITE